MKPNKLNKNKSNFDPLTHYDSVHCILYIFVPYFYALI